MEWLKQITWTPLNIAKAIAALLVALFVVLLVIRIMSPLTGTLLGVRGMNTSSGGFAVGAPAMEPMMYQTDDSYGYAEESVAADMGMGRGGGAQLSLTNIGVPEPYPVPGGTVGADAEDYEVTQYTASIESRDSAATCKTVAALKDRDAVIFENANEYERGCSYTFKVARAEVAAVLSVLDSLNPKSLTENTYTIKRQLEDFSSQTDILQAKLAAIDETLQNAARAYDELAQLATQTKDAESLASIIDSKINTIERLTQQRISITAQLEQLSRAKAEQLDRLAYTYFTVNVYENKFIDGESLKESWKQSVQSAVRDMNRIAQDLTINLITFILWLAQYIIYFFILLFVVKYLWHVVRQIWKS